MWQKKGAMELRRIYLWWAVVALCVLITCPCLASGVPELSARSAIVTDAQGTVLYEKDADLRLPPASVTKVMTLLLAVEAVEHGTLRIDEMITASAKAAGEGGSQIWLKDGETMRAYDMMTAIAVVSANDAAFAVMEHLYDSETNAVEAMNQRAKELGMKDTHFVNVNGLPADDHYMSVRDVAKLSCEAVRHPLYLELCGKKEVWLREGKNWLVNTNKLLWWYAGADGLKTGWTQDAKYCFAGTALKDQMRLIAVVFAAEEPRSHLRESMALLDWGYRNYQYIKIADTGDVVGAANVRGGNQEWVNLVAADNIGYLEKRGKDKRNIAISLPESIDAPVQAGDACGELTIRENGKTIVRTTLLAETTVRRAGFGQIVYRNLHYLIGIKKHS